MIRTCTGPQGEPGYQAVIDGVPSECFTYDPANPLSKSAAIRKTTRLHEEADAARAAGVPGP